MKALLEIHGEKNVTIRPYLPEKYCPTPGYLKGPIPKGYDCLINIEDCEGSYIDCVSPSLTGKAYYKTY